MRDDIISGVKVCTVGTIGFVTSLKLADAATLVSIAVGLATLVYIGAKTYFLFKNQGRGGSE